MSRYYSSVRGSGPNSTTKTGTAVTGMRSTTLTGTLSVEVVLQPYYEGLTDPNRKSRLTDDDMVSLHVNGYRVAFLKASELTHDDEPRFNLAKHLLERLLPAQKLELFNLLAPDVVLALIHEPVE